MAHEFSDGILSLSDSQSVTRNDAHALAVFEGLNSASNVDFFVNKNFTFFNRARDLSTKTTHDDVDKRTVHTVTHDLGEEGSRGTDQGTNNAQERLVKDETFGAERPTGIGVQKRDDDRHISTANRCCHVETKKTRGNDTGSQACVSSACIIGTHELDHGDQRGSTHTKVHQVTPGESKRVRTELFGKFAIGDNRSSGSDGTHPSTNVDGTSVETIHMSNIMNHVVTNSSGSGCKTDQGMKGGNVLRQRGRGNFLGNAVTEEAANTSTHEQLSVDSSSSIHSEGSCSKTSGNTASGKVNSQTRTFLG
mmetsp:Transcript_23132/g.32667  ORF Transcript_23132/g.32667 Transcript_23132/m.32667 type:complete len:307 (+) Transcript_23132:502-1422(+)